MAKLYGLNIDDFKAEKLVSFGSSFTRLNGQPLDKTDVWYAQDGKTGLERAQEYAKTASAYVGQVISVINAPESEDDAAYTVDVYKIEIDNEGESVLVKVGSSEDIESLNTEIAQLITNINSALSSISELNTNVSGIQSEIGTIKNDISKAEESIEANITSIEAIEEDVEQLKTDIDLVEELAANNKLRLDEYDTAKANYALKDDIDKAKNDAIAAAKTETESQISTIVSTYLTGEGAADTIDTLQEIADWIADDKAGATKLIADVKAISDDYLKASDKTELSEAITAVDNKIGTFPEDAESDNLIDYIKEVATADLAVLDEDFKAVKAKVTTIEETTLPSIASDISGINTKIAALEEIDHSHKNAEALDSITSDKINAWDAAANDAHSHDNESVLAGIDQDKIDLWDTVVSKANASDLTNLETIVSNIQTEVASIPTTLLGKVDKKVDEDSGREHRLLTPAEADILAKLSLNDDGNVETGQKVTAGNVEGLAQWIADNAPEQLKGKIGSAQLTDELVTKLNGSVQQIMVDGNVLNNDNGLVEIPLASQTTSGTVMLGTEFDIAESGKMEVKSINVNKLAQLPGEVLELNGGNASGSFN